MMFKGTVMGPRGFDIRTFECIVCDYAETVMIGTNITGWINSRELRPPS
jgi:hypothetical protein